MSEKEGKKGVKVVCERKEWKVKKKICIRISRKVVHGLFDTEICKKENRKGRKKIKVQREENENKM